MKRSDEPDEVQPARNAIGSLIREAHSHGNGEDYIASLVAQIRQTSCQPEELEHTIGALRQATQRYLGTGATSGPAYRCNFCGRSQDKVDALLVSAEGSMCDECAVEVLDSISHARGQIYLRIAFFFFRVVASIGRVFHDILRKNWRRPALPQKLSE